VTEHEQVSQEDLAGDLISQDQVALDAEQAGESAVQAPTAEQYQQVLRRLDQQAAEIEKNRKDTAGYASKVDTGLNAIRRDTQAAAETRINQELAQGRERYLTTLRETNPELEAATRQHLEVEDAAAVARAALVQPTPSPAAQPQVVQGQDQAAWEQVFGMVRDFGVDPNDPRVDYRVLVDETLSEGIRRQRFMQSLRNATATPAAAPAAAPQTPATRTVTPPVEGGTQRAGGYRNIDDVYSAYTSDRISKQEYIDAAQKLGVNP
jgi:hypothetical protein